MHLKPRLLLPLLAVCTGAAVAQSNTIPGRDIQLADTWAIQAYTHQGAFPNGACAIGSWTTVCNPGTSGIPFQAAMSPNHAFIHYLIARESGGRLVQISNYGWVKHTFGSSNDPSACGNCAGPGNFSMLEVGCSDTYANSQAVDHYWLGPPSEVDPWLGTWVPNCSHFDQGEPIVAPSQTCDGVRSLTSQQANALNTSLHHQTQVRDAEFNVPGAQFYWQSGYLVPAEAEANRTNNIASRNFTPTWNGSQWSLADGNTFVPGSILQRWSGATVTSNSNGADDGRFYVAVKVTGPTNGMWHYEYAVHNRDNNRGMGALHIPVCAAARVANFGFHDIDTDPLDDWQASFANGEVVFTTSTNALRWNSIYNFWFDCDAAPVTSTLNLTQFDLGAGALFVPVTSTAPAGLFNQTLGPGCGSPNAPNLFATGAPSRAQIPNSSFSLRSTGNPAGAPCFFVVAGNPGTLQLSPGCTLYNTDLASLLGPFFTVAGNDGATTLAMPVPNIPALEGLNIDFQMANVATGGAHLGNYNLSSGLRVRIGNAILGCP